MNPVYLVVCLLIVLAALVNVARRLDISYPIVLVIGGLLLALFPRLPEVRLEPEIVFLVFLPPLLYWDALNSSWRDFRDNRRSISFLAIGLVLASTIAVMLVAHLMLGFTWPTAFVLGAVLGPTDTVAAAAILERFKLPRRLVSVLRGESLLNDALALVLYETAVHVTQTKMFVFGSISIGFSLAAAGGIAIGLASWLGDASDSAPYIGPVGEKYDRFADGICRLSASRRAPRVWCLSRCHRGALSRLGRPANHVCQDPAAIDRNLGGHDVSAERSVIYSHWTATADNCEVSPGGVVPLHHLWLPVGQWNSHSGSHPMGVSFNVCSSRIEPSTTVLTDLYPVWHEPVLISWIGIRGGISLAAALAIPTSLANGSPFPRRNEILILTFAVILVTLVIQGLSLPRLLRWLNFPTDDAERAEEQRARETIAAVALQFLASTTKEDEIHRRAVRHLQDIYRNRAEGLDLADQARQRNPETTYLNQIDSLDRELVRLQRSALIDLRDRGTISDAVLRRFQVLLDLEEARLEEQEHRFHG